MAAEEEERRPAQATFSVNVLGPRRGVAHVVLGGELDMVSAPELQRGFGELLRGRAARVVIHLDRLTFIDSAGLRALIAIDDAAVGAGADIRLLPGSPAVMRVVEAAGLRGRLPFAEHDQP
jgi:anti-anti-sigma factor